MKFWSANYCKKPSGWPDSIVRTYTEKGTSAVPKGYVVTSSSKSLCIPDTYKSLVNLLQTTSDRKRQAEVDAENRNVVVKGIGALLSSDGPAYDINRKPVSYTYLPAAVADGRRISGPTYFAEAIQEEGAKGKYVVPARYTSSTDWKKYHDKTDLVEMDRSHGTPCSNRSPFVANGYFLVASPDSADDIVRGRGGAVSRGDVLYYTRDPSGKCYLIGKFPKIKYTIVSSQGAKQTRYRDATPKETWKRALEDVTKLGHKSEYFMFDPSWGAPSTEMVSFAKASPKNATLMLRPQTMQSKEAYDTYLLRLLADREIANNKQQNNIASGVAKMEYLRPLFENGKYLGLSVLTPAWDPWEGVSDAKILLLKKLPSCTEAVRDLAKKKEDQLIKKEFEDAKAEILALDREILIEAGYLQREAQDILRSGGDPGGSSLSPGETSETAANEKTNWPLWLGIAGLGFVAYKVLV